MDIPRWSTRISGKTRYYIKNQTSGNRFLGLHLLLPVADPGERAKPVTTTTVHAGHPALARRHSCDRRIRRGGDPRRPTPHPSGGRRQRTFGARSSEVSRSRANAGRSDSVRITWRDLRALCTATRSRSRPATTPSSSQHKEEHDEHANPATEETRSAQRPPNVGQPGHGVHHLGHTVFGFEQSSWRRSSSRSGPATSARFLFEWVDARANGRRPAYAGGGVRKVIDFLLRRT